MKLTRLNEVPTLHGLAFLGWNVTEGSANDTRAFWKNLGPGYVEISQLNMLNGQPSQYGFLINLTEGDEIQQEFWSQPNGKHYKRGGNGSTTAMPAWTEIIAGSGGIMDGLLSFTENGLPNAGTSTDFFATGINAFANGGRLAYKGLNDMKTWLGINAPSVLSGTSAITLGAGGQKINWVSLYKWGRIGYISFGIYNKNSISVPAGGNIGNQVLGTIVSGYRPIARASFSGDGDNVGPFFGSIDTGGNITVGALEGTGAARTVAAGQLFVASCCYITA